MTTKILKNVPEPILKYLFIFLLNFYRIFFKPSFNSNFMANQDNLEKIFGPYDIHPRVYVSDDNSKPTLKRILKEEQIEPEDSKDDGIGCLLSVLYYFYLYNPKIPPEPKPYPRNIYSEEVLCELATDFEIKEEHGKFYVHARIES